MELFLEKELISFEAWKGKIEHLKENLPASSLASLQEALVEAVRKRIPSKPFGLMFSGGVDSSTLALILNQVGADFICYTVGIEGSEDIAVSQEVAKKLGLKHRIKVLSEREVDSLFETCAKILPQELFEKENLAVLFGVAAVEIAAIELAKKDNLSFFFGGLGSEEIFAGYQRHEKAENVDEECWRGLIQMYHRDLLRDCAIASHFKIGVATPFLDPDVIRQAMGLDMPKLDKDSKKLPIRWVAEQLGLPKEYAWRPKKAAQYGSRFDKALERLAKQEKLSKAAFLVKKLRGENPLP